MINVATLSNGQTSNERTALFCKTWGFLKYHHPAVTSTNINWDSVFVNNIQQAIKAKTNADFNKRLIVIINAAGPVVLTKPSRISDSLFTLNSTGIDWVKQSSIFNYDVKQKLKIIYYNKNQGDNKYIKIINNTANFSSENKYDSITFPTAEYRLLFLARFWNIINYFAPYKYLTPIGIMF